MEMTWGVDPLHPGVTLVPLENENSLKLWTLKVIKAFCSNSANLSVLAKFQVIFNLCMLGAIKCDIGSDSGGEVIDRALILVGPSVYLERVIILINESAI